MEEKERDEEEEKEDAFLLTESPSRRTRQRLHPLPQKTACAGAAISGVCFFMAVPLLTLAASVSPAATNARRRGGMLPRKKVVASSGRRGRDGDRRVIGISFFAFSVLDDGPDAGS